LRFFAISSTHRLSFDDMDGAYPCPCELGDGGVSDRFAHGKKVEEPVKSDAWRPKMLIDVHAHQFPAKYIEAIARHGRRIADQLAAQSIEERIQHMDDASVDIQVLSPANVVPYFENEAVATDAARILNDGYAELSNRLPKRFKAFASLPMPHVDASLREMERGLDILGFAGITLGCSILNRPVIEKQFEPLYQEMNRRRTIVFFHPVVNGLCSPLLNDFNLGGAVGTTMEDTVVALHLIVGQIQHRYPEIRIIVPHLGGLIPMLLHRMDNQLSALYRDLPEKPSVTAKRFWYDTVGHGSSIALRCACDAFGANHLVTGSDYPVLLPFETYAQTFSYIGDVGLPTDAAEQILHRTAAELFGVADVTA
jgi:predicted TIM-barrel fold metal-dependent hydrolase